MSQDRELDQFPYPFKDNVYRYSNNSIPMKVPASIEITPSYLEEIKLKRALLENFPERCYQSRSFTLTAQWEILQLLAEHLAEYYPEQFVLVQKGDSWTLQNHLLKEEQSFTFGSVDTLPDEPLNFIGRHVQEDLLLMGQRDGDLFLDAGQLCFPANWSLAFNLGMRFKEIHHPIPGFKEEKLDDRILAFLMRLEAGNPWERKNWSLQAGDTLDSSLETFDQWGKKRKEVTKENAGQLVHLRVEVQKLFRLPRSHAILFTIHSHLLPLEKFCSKREWLEQFYAILQELPPYIADYKGIARYKEAVMDYLKDRQQSGSVI